MAHDFNNMLSIILGNTEIMMEDMDHENPLSQNLEEIKKAAERSINLTRQLLAFARRQTISPKVIDLNRMVEGMLKMLGRLIGEDIDLARHPATDLWPVKIDPSQIDQVLANLSLKTRDAIKDVGKITIETKNVRFDEIYCMDHAGFTPGEFVLLAVSDDGCGMTPEILDNLFEPFFTTKDTHKGTGLGLATVYGIIKQNNGFINVYSEPDMGTSFKIYLPREEQASENLLITDVVMPEMNGKNLAQALSSQFPGLKCLFMSGYTANVIAHHGVLDKGVSFIRKPFSGKELALAVRKIISETP